MTFRAKIASFLEHDHTGMWVFLIASALLLASLLIGLIADNTRTWGFHFLRYFSIPLRVAFTLAGLLAATLAWRAHRVFSSDLRPSHQSAPNPLIADLAAAVLCAVIFVLFRAATPVLGDGQLWINELGEGSVPFWDRRGPLTLALYDALFQAWNAGGNLNPQRVFQAGAAVAGGITVFAWLRAARALGIPAAAALLLAALWGGVAQFFGYVELYAPMIALVSVMFWRIIVSLHDQKFCWAVPVLALAAPWFHFIALTVLPAAALYVWWGVAHRLPKFRTLSAIALVLFASAGLGYAALGWHRGTTILLPLWPRPDWSYAVLSANHLLDLANGLALILGPGIVLLFSLWRPLPKTEESPLRTILTASLLVPFAAYVMHHPQLGMARDWDIGAALLCAVPFAFFLG
ncbi:MAG: hypothetical protein PHI18_02670, partial [bacterium]|nr:hypothetical protein [bacterium]